MPAFSINQFFIGTQISLKVFLSRQVAQEQCLIGNVLELEIFHDSSSASFGDFRCTNKI